MIALSGATKGEHMARKEVSTHAVICVQHELYDALCVPVQQLSHHGRGEVARHVSGQADPLNGWQALSR